MISTAVIVGEINATDWASTVGKPRARVRRPERSLPPGAAVVAGDLVASVVLTGLLLTP
jgi:hypothetical protein